MLTLIGKGGRYIVRVLGVVLTGTRENLFFICAELVLFTTVPGPLVDFRPIQLQALRQTCDEGTVPIRIALIFNLENRDLVSL